MCFGPVPVRGDSTVDRDDLLSEGKNQKKVGGGAVHPAVTIDLIGVR